MTGARNGRIVVRHILPSTLAPVIVNATLTLGFAIIAESSLRLPWIGRAAADTDLGTDADWRPTVHGVGALRIIADSRHLSLR